MLRTLAAALALAFAVSPLPAADDGPHLGNGLKIGEVTSDSAIVWVRLTASKERVSAPFGSPPPAQRVVDAEIAKLPGALPGMAGDAFLLVSTQADFSSRQELKAAAVDQQTDFIHQWRVGNLQPATKYFVRVTARGAGGSQTAQLDGSFTTAAGETAWQDVKFAVMSCQSHKDRDDVNGFKIYPAMQKLGLNFYVATGDNVYYDSDPPLATTVEMARFHWHRMHGLPWLVDFHRTVPGYWEKDDHDSFRNDDWPPPGRNADRIADLTGELNFFKGLKIFREQVPMGDKTYRTARWGKGLQIWLTEGRDFRSPNNMPDGPDKTIWGKEQMEWVRSSILASDAEFKVLISPTPIVGPDRGNKADNFSNKAFGHEGNAFRAWTKENKLDNLFVCCGDRHWQYHSVDPASGLHEFACGAASDQHAGGSPGLDEQYHKFHRVKGGFLTLQVFRERDRPVIALRHHDVNGAVVHEHVYQRPLK
jgi:alkaline phosphatase D